jgi:hypothetical protein
VSRSDAPATASDLGLRPTFDLRDKQVRGLEVAMEDSLLVRVLDTAAHPSEERQALRDGQSTVVAVLGERQPRDQLHGEVREPVFGGPGLIELGDVGMREPRHRLALGGESRHGNRAAETGVHQLEGDLALDRLALLGQVDGSHAALAEEVDDAEGADALRMVERGRFVFRRPGDGGAPTAWIDHGGSRVAGQVGRRSRLTLRGRAMRIENRRVQAGRLGGFRRIRRLSGHPGSAVSGGVRGRFLARDARYPLGGLLVPLAPPGHTMSGSRMITPLPSMS